MARQSIRTPRRRITRDRSPGRDSVDCGLQKGQRLAFPGRRFAATYEIFEFVPRPFLSLFFFFLKILLVERIGKSSISIINDNNYQLSNLYLGGCEVCEERLSLLAK